MFAFLIGAALRHEVIWSAARRDIVSAKASQRRRVTNAIEHMNAYTA